MSQYNFFVAPRVIAAVTVFTAIAACGDDVTSGMGASEYYPGGATVDGYYRDAGAALPAEGDYYGDNLPPEEEEGLQGGDFKSSAPVVSKQFVYVANPTLGTVARIDPQTLQVHSIRVGPDPAGLITLPDRDSAVLIIRGEKKLALITSTTTTDAVTYVSLSEPYDTIAVSPDGRYAIAFFLLDAAAEETLGDTWQNFNKVAIVDLEQAVTDAAAAVLERPVSFRVTNVVFTSDSAAAYIVTQSDIALVDFAALAEVSRLERIPLVEADSSDEAADPEGYTEVASREVAATPDGAFIFVRGFYSSKILVVDTATAEKANLSLNGIPTDMDVAPSGKSLVAVVRARNEVAIFRIPEDLGGDATPTVIAMENVLVGQAVLSPAEDKALLFTNTAADYREEVTVLDLQTGDYEVIGHAHGLDKAIRSAAFAPGGKTAFLLHRPANGDPNATGISIEEKVDRSEGYTLLDLSDYFVVQRLLTQEPQSPVFTTDGEFLAVLIDEGGAQLEIAELRTLLIATGVTLPSAPIFAGVIPASRLAYVLQDYPVGRISFIDLLARTVKTVTGFELDTEVQ